MMLNSVTITEEKINEIRVEMFTEEVRMGEKK